jgi:proline iminopeptidase
MKKFSPDRAHFIEILRKARQIASPGGVEELLEISIGGVQQWISIRGKDARNPIVLFVHGGPGSPEMPTSWLYQSGWEDYFVVVQWDQRGCGKSGNAVWPEAADGASLIDGMVADAREMVAFLRDRFEREKIVVLGHSWGTVLGTSLAVACPEWLHAYVGVGQVVDWVENERASFSDVVEQAKLLGLADASAELEGLAPYPDTEPSSSVFVRLLTERKWVVQLGGMMHGCKDLDLLERVKTLCPEYTDTDLDTAGQAEAAVERLLPELMRYNIKELVKLDCPVVIVAGRHDFATPSRVARQWYERLQAPSKHWVWFERSAHMPHLEEPGRFLSLLVSTVRPLAQCDTD